MKYIVVSTLLLFLLGCSTTPKEQNDGLITAWLNEDKRATLNEPSQMSLNAQRVFVLLLHSKEGTKVLPSTLNVVDIESYGPELEIWTIQRANGELVEYNLENPGSTFRVRNIKAENESNDKPLEMSLFIGGR